MLPAEPGYLRKPDMFTPLIQPVLPVSEAPFRINKLHLCRPGSFPLTLSLHSLGRVYCAPGLVFTTTIF